jgi:hypothetical protein
LNGDAELAWSVLASEALQASFWKHIQTEISVSLFVHNSLLRASGLLQDRPSQATWRDCSVSQSVDISLKAMTYVVHVAKGKDVMTMLSSKFDGRTLFEIRSDFNGQGASERIAIVLTNYPSDSMTATL